MEESILVDNMFENSHRQLGIEIDKPSKKHQFDSPLCSSSNTSSSSSKTTNPSDPSSSSSTTTKPLAQSALLSKTKKETTTNNNNKFISAAFIPLNQSRTIDLDTKKAKKTSSNRRDNDNPLLSSSSSSSSVSSSTSSVVASLSVLSFSDSNSISSLSSSISYGDVEPHDTCEDSNIYFTNSTSVFHNKNKSSEKLASLKSLPRSLIEQSSNSLDKFVSASHQTSADRISELTAPYKGKAFYGKDWIVPKLNNFLLDDRSSKDELINETEASASRKTNFLVLLGDSGTGKSHLSCELKWPGSGSVFQSVNSQMIGVYFLNWFNPRQNNVQQFTRFLKKSLHEFCTVYQKNNEEEKEVGGLFKSVQSLDLHGFGLSDNYIDLANDLHQLDESFVTELANEFIVSTLMPLKDMTFLDDINSNSDSNKRHFFLIDGIDEAVLHTERLRTQKKSGSSLSCSSSTSLIDSPALAHQIPESEALLMLLNKVVPFLPDWLTIIMTSKRCIERSHLKRHLGTIKYDKLSMDRCLNVSTMLTSNSNSGNSNQLKKQFQESASGSNSSVNNTQCNSLQTSVSSHSLRVSTTTTQESVQQQQQQPVQKPSQLNRLSTPIELCNAAHFANLKDIQTFILKRLDNDGILKKKFNKANAVELINLLLIKSNFCILYVEKILDFILNDFISSNEIKSIPVTLNGFYLYLIQRILQQQSDQTALNAKTKKEILYSIFALCLLDSQPFEKRTLFTKLSARYHQLTETDFDTFFQFIEPLLFKRAPSIDTQPDRFLIFHSSLIEWFTDIKFCTQSYLVNLPEAHLTLALYHYNEMQRGQESNDSETNWNLFKFHLAKSNPVLSKAQMNYFKLICQNSETVSLQQLQHQLDQSQPSQYQIDPSSKQLQQQAVQKSSPANSGYEQIFFELIGKNDSASLKEIIVLNPQLVKLLLQMTDEFNQNALLIAVKLNNPIMCEYLIGLGRKSDLAPHDFLEHCDSTGWTSLRYSAWMGYDCVVKVLLENGAHVDESDSEGRTALRAACFNGHQSVVDVLLKYRADVNKLDCEQRSVLHVAVLMGHSSLVTFLLKRGANINQRDSLGRGMISTCIYSSAANPTTKTKIMKTLINYGANLNEVDVNGQTPIILATLENQPALVSAMVDLGADMDFIDNNCYTAVAYAVKKNLSELVDLFLRKNAATHILDTNGRSIFSIACLFNSKQALASLMERGLDEMHRDNSGWTPLHEASYSGHLAIAQMLIDYGSELDACDNDGKTSVFYACQEGHLDMVQLLVMRGASLCVRSHQGVSPMRVATLYNRRHICEYLLQQPTNIDINYVDTDGRTMLFNLIQTNGNNLDTIELLLSHGASVMTRGPDGWTCFHLCASVGNQTCFKLLLLYHSNLEVTDSNGCTPLQVAVVQRHDSLVTFMLSLKQRLAINNQDKLGNTALSLVCQNNNVELAEQLLQNGAQVYASNKNLIKLAHQAGNESLVKLLQQWSLQCYNQSMAAGASGLKKSPTIYENTKAISQVTGIPRNSKSVESFKPKSARLSHMQSNESLIMRQQQQYRVGSHYAKGNGPSVKQQNGGALSYHVSNSPFGGAQASKFEDLRMLNQRNRSLMINLNDYAETERMSPVKSENKSSRFKMVKDKLLRKPSVLSNQSQGHQNHQKPALMKQSKSIDSSVASSSASSSHFINQQHQVRSSTPVTSSPGNKSTSFRIFISSLQQQTTNGTNSTNISSASTRQSDILSTKYSMLNNRSPKNLDPIKLRESELKRSTSFAIERPITCVSHTPNGPGESKLKHSKSITNSSFYQMIRKKLKFLKTGSALAEQGTDDEDGDEFVFRNNKSKIQRSITDASSIFQKQTDYVEALNQKHANSVNHLTNTSNIKEDDVAYIFNRDSLNDCLNPRSSYRLGNEQQSQKARLNYSSFMKNSNMNLLAGNSVGGTSSSSDSSSNSRESAYQQQQQQQQKAQLSKMSKNPMQSNNRPNSFKYFKKETSI